MSVEVGPISRRRVLALVVLSLVGYVVCLLLIALAAGFDHALTRWLLAAGLLAAGVGMAASVMWRWILFRDAQLLRAGTMISTGLRAGIAILFVVLAIGQLRS